MNRIDPADLFRLYCAGEATEEERKLLLDWISKSENTEKVKALMKEAWDRLEEDSNVFSKEQSKKILEDIKFAMSEDVKQTVRVRAEKKFLWLKRAVAVVVVLMIGSTLFYFNVLNKQENNPSAKTYLKNDVPPGGNKAILTLNNGRKINLNNIGNGILGMNGHARIVKQDSSHLVYRFSKEEHVPRGIAYNTLTTPRGGQYQLELSDGTKVWLNAASSIRFPTAFSGKERKVEITGEVYFEVAQNKDKPFKVVADKMLIDVLGTHFNINTYKDEPIARTTLLEGSVKITAQDKSMLLRPGQQAGIKKGSNEIVRSDANMEEVVAWKDGVFHFEGDDMADIMRRISRWYNVEVTYKNGVPKGHYTGVISRNTNLSQVLEVLELSGIHFEIKGRNILVEG